MANTILVTGANRGIGLELVRQLTARGDAVIAVCRASSPALDALGVRVEAGVDVTSDADVAALDERLGALQLDGLVLNAGVLRRGGLADLDFDAIREQLEVNTLGPLRVAARLRARLGRGGKIAVITSRMGSVADNTSGGMYGYRMSKAAVNMVGKSLAIDLEPAGIAVALVHPGWVKTDMTGGQGLVDAATSAADILARYDALDLAATGTFYHANGEVLPW
ncbi:MAG: short-chain dehydrogenase [Deltaproteobacteria bacterium HGW-Deltaproteobacteria-14]|jgi:NAD(P)-dependent dehydrogenase (short-subunit alcohol dehydrogenase family)|nr:MAG: short-chain dehydrogenase [Deltaproteobacteria bacterium HGW-Deltaproteobacteria-14]